MTQPPTGPGGQPSYPPSGAGQPVPHQYGPPGQPPAEPTQQFGQYGSAQPPHEPTQQFGQYQPAQPPPEPTRPFGQYGPPPQGQPQQPQSAPPYGQPQQPQSAPPYGQPQQPQSAPPYGQPQSAAPFGQPQQPHSAPPFGQQPPGAGYPQPMSAPPGATPPYGPATPASGGRRKPTVLILALVAGLLFVLGGVMTGLYVTKGNELDSTRQRLTAQVSERDGTITANKAEIEKLKKDLQGVRDKLSDTEQDLTGTRNDRDEQARQKKVIANCLNKLTTALNAAAANNKAAYDKATQGLNKVCDEAENYL
ncbi:hypothetical protein [Micromonospora sp. DT233]|uniref:hypothetical protein n=1 Tax=Micromonospora sp. DT233 TaxID=3393432 RepID=UPI003CF1416B